MRPDPYPDLFVALRMALMAQLQECQSRIENTHRQMRALTDDIQDKIKRMTEEVEVKVGRRRRFIMTFGDGTGDYSY